MFAEMCEHLDIDKTRTTPWHLQSDGQTERFNRTLFTCLQQLVSYDQTDGDLYISFITCAYRATQHKTTRYSPNMLMIGRETPMPLELAIGWSTMDEQDIPHRVIHVNNLLPIHKKVRFPWFQEEPSISVPTELPPLREAMDTEETDDDRHEGAPTSVQVDPHFSDSALDTGDNTHLPEDEDGDGGQRTRAGRTVR